MMSEKEFNNLKVGDTVVTKGGNTGEVVAVGVPDTLGRGTMIKLKISGKSPGCPFYFRYELRGKDKSPETFMSKVYFRHGNCFDKTAVGLIFYDTSGTVFVEYSDDKLRGVKSRLKKEGSKSTYSLFKFGLRGIKASALDDTRVRELSINLNGIIGITEPSKIALACTEGNFIRLFDKMV